MPKLFFYLFISAALALSSNPVVAEDAVADANEFVSGVPLDEPVDSFDVQIVSGPLQGRTLCYTCRYGGKPVIAVFFKKLDEPLVQLLAGVNETAHSFENKKLRAFGIYLTDDPEGAKAELAALAAEHEWENLPLTVYDGESGPVNYEIKEQATVNVMMWTKARVKATHAYRSIDELTQEERGRILQDTEKILPN